MVFEATTQFLDRHAIRSELVHRVWVCWRAQLEPERVRVAVGALDLLARHDPRRLDRLRRDVDLVQVSAYRSSYWDPQGRTLWISPSRTSIDTAASLVHDATHARLGRLAWPEQASWDEPAYVLARLREERLCLLEERRFIQRLRGADVAWTPTERETLEAHGPWVDAVLAFGEAYFAELVSKGGLALRDLPRPSERPEPPIGETPDWNHQSEEYRFLHEIRQAVYLDREMRRALDDFRPAPWRKPIDAVRETGRAARRVVSAARANARRRSRQLRYFRDPWNAELLEGVGAYP